MSYSSRSLCQWCSENRIWHNHLFTIREKKLITFLTTFLCVCFTYRDMRDLQQASYLSIFLEKVRVKLLVREIKLRNFGEKLKNILQRRWCCTRHYKFCWRYFHRTLILPALPDFGPTLLLNAIGFLTDTDIVINPFFLVVQLWAIPNIIHRRDYLWWFLTVRVWQSRQVWQHCWLSELYF